MRYSYRLLALSGAAALVAAQTPDNDTICNFYTAALLGENSAMNQLTVLTLVVNTAVIGSYDRPMIPNITNPEQNVTWPDVEVDGILNPDGMFENTPVNLMPYFDGTFNSTNRGGDMGESVSFLDGGGADPLMANLPAAEDMMDSNQYRLLTHLYSYFGTLLGCSEVGTDDFPSYSGESSQATVHQFMALNTAEVSYFITQVGMAAARFGVGEADVTGVGQTLNGIFNVRCAAPVNPIPDQEPELQSICIAEDCMQAEGGDCGAYPAVIEPSAVSSGGAMPSGSEMPSGTGGSEMPSGTGDMASSATEGGDMPSATGGGMGGAASETPAAAARAGVGMAMGAVAAAAALML